MPCRPAVRAMHLRHVTARAKKKYRGRPLSPVTLRKEVASFRAACSSVEETEAPEPCVEHRVAGCATSPVTSRLKVMRHVLRPVAARR